ncbi:molecular chaperone DnaK [Paraclostridium bifermentans]
MRTDKMNLFGNYNKVDEKEIPAFGIDLGTTNSAIAVVAEGTTPEIIKLDNHKPTMPSCVMWLGEDENGEDKFIVGQEAYEHRELPNVKYSVKGMMGTKDKVKLTYNGVTKEFTPERISAEILKGLCQQVSYNYPCIKDVVITIPAYFDNNQIEATRKAGELAGLNVLATFREPTAAALLYTSVKTTTKEEHILVYDLGGGTFDVSLVKSRKVEVRPDMDEFYGFPPREGEDSNGIVLDVLAKNGDMHLGGDDIDKAMYKLMENKLMDAGVDVSKLTDSSREFIILQLEDMKKGGKLRNGPGNFQSNWDLEYVDGTKLTEIKISVTIQDFLIATEKIYSKTKKLLEEMLVSHKRIDNITLVGGSTKSAILKGLLKSDYPDLVINDALNPDESVALGAALQAKRLKYGDKNIRVFDILPLSVGVLSNGRINKILHKNQSVPFTQTKKFVTIEDNQREIDIDVYQGNSSLPEECTYLGKLIVNDLPDHEKGKLPIFVKLSVNADGVLKCAASVAGKYEEVELINVIKGNLDTNEQAEDKTLDKLTLKKINRWKKMAKRQENPNDSKLLLELIKQFENSEIDEEYLVESMQKIRNN